MCLKADRRTPTDKWCRQWHHPLQSFRRYTREGQPEIMWTRNRFIIVGNMELHQCSVLVLRWDACMCTTRVYMPNLMVYSCALV